MPWLDHDHFLPSAIQRYHQLFLPALQLIDAILATLGPGHSFAVNQVEDGLLAGRIDVLRLID
jgi:nuclear pore complex protein Nup205